MRIRRLAAALLVALPLSGCVFAVGTGGGDDEALRDKVRQLEKRVDRLEAPGQVPMQTIMIQGEAK